MLLPTIPRRYPHDVKVHRPETTEIPHHMPPTSVKGERRAFGYAVPVAQFSDWRKSSDPALQSVSYIRSVRRATGLPTFAVNLAPVRKNPQDMNYGLFIALGNNITKEWLELAHRAQGDDPKKDRVKEFLGVDFEPCWYPIDTT